MFLIMEMEDEQPLSSSEEEGETGIFALLPDTVQSWGPSIPMNATINVIDNN
jgi:hypothetical protein